ncbi:Clp protease ClpP [Listeria monocytogenes]|uniref:Clp protease-like protein n=3 Tax=root TaxID=1 RepID=R4ICB0_9CAUD|nr:MULTISPECIES: head maturation protease, ClpP-related [Listeria]YP_008126700.1 head maturation protease [Listeria phage LP-030-2]EAG8533027.1 Clp protease ClpP [Listeria innocua]AFN39942.1 Clp protease-like protein [Listeria phage LP-030-2]AVV12590.1 Clp protease ClpP [Listeria monocytogenes]AXO75358.1 Clp protease ClpP [Listeria monocytogenes]EAA0055284.1 Clp protease ClpP [Listeria monocytogenes]
MKMKEIPKIESRLEFKNSSENPEVAELYLYGTIGNGWFDDITSGNVKEFLNTSDVSQLNVHVNSGGGDVFESIAIHNLLKSHSAKISIYIDGLAGSGASVIAMAGDEIIMPRNAMMMIHKAWTVAAGNADEFRKVANDMDKIDHAVTESYTGRFVGEREELVTLLTNEEWLTADECMALGFCDSVGEIQLNENEDEPEDSNENEAQTVASIVDKYKVVASTEKKKIETKNNIFKSIANRSDAFLLGGNEK